MISLSLSPYSLSLTLFSSPSLPPMRDMFPVKEMRDFIGQWFTEDARNLQHCNTIHDLQNNFGNYILIWLQNNFQRASHLFFNWERETYTKKPTTIFGNYHRLQIWKFGNLSRRVTPPHTI